MTPKKIESKLFDIEITIPGGQAAASCGRLPYNVRVISHASLSI